jgi:hypothetical protein
MVCVEKNFIAALFDNRPLFTFHFIILKKMRHKKCGNPESFFTTEQRTLERLFAYALQLQRQFEQVLFDKTGTGSAVGKQ